jgi:biopolymer transport protein ExbB
MVHAPAFKPPAKTPFHTKRPDVRRPAPLPRTVFRRYKLRMIDYMQKGGPLMWLILFCSVLAGAVFLERVSYFHRITVRVGEFMRGLANLIEHRRFAEAQMECAGTPTPVTRFIHAAILRHQSTRAELKDIVAEAGQLEVPRLERRLGILATIAFITPLIGLLGTVVGLIEAFVNISTQSGFAGATDIASGIYQSLLTTAAGLVVAIPCAVGYSYLSSRVNTLMHDMERAGIEIVNLITEHRFAPSPEIIDFGAQSRAVQKSAE